MKTRANGISVNYELHGKEGAPWLVLSHSLACSVRMWDEQIAAFKDRFRILAYDTRGHGGTDAPAGAYTLDMLAEDARALLDAVGVRRCHWVGLSMGGMIGQTLALKHPGLFQSLTLADTSSRIPAEAAPIWAERIKVAEAQGMKPHVEPTLARWFTEPYRKSGAKRVADVAALIAGTPVTGYVGCCHAIPKLDTTARLKEIKCPILIIVGEQDMGTPVAMSREIHDNAPGSKLAILPSASHLSNIEQPEAFNRALAGFLGSK
jgi:3-oxoadipate enol-lactonase